MSYKLNKPFTTKQRADFIVEYNHQKGLTIQESESAIYALEAFELLQGDTVIDNTEEYNKKLQEEEQQRIKSLTCTKRVFALVLQKFGISYTVLKELIATNENAQLEWDLCIELQRSNPLLDVMAQQLNVTSEQIDAIFLYANNELTDEDITKYINNNEDINNEENNTEESDTEETEEKEVVEENN